MSKKYYASLCVTTRNDYDLLEIWIPYYFMIGFDHIYLIDNRSDTFLNQVPLIKSYIEKEKITYHYEPKDNQQIQSYNFILNHYRHETVWLAIFDTDEFLVLHKDNDIKDFLKRYEAFGAVSICWYQFGSNEHISHQADLFDAYTKRQQESNHYKTIIYTDRVTKYEVHCPKIFVGNFYAVDEAFNRVYGPFTKYQTTEFTQLNHYVIRSLEDFQRKMNRRYPGSPNTINFFNNLNASCNTVDTSIFDSLNRIQPNWRDIIDSSRFKDFDPDTYKQKYPDLQKMNNIQLYFHYSIYGQNENRTYK